MNIFLNEDPCFIPDWLSQVDSADDMVDLSPKVNVDLVIDDQGHTAVHWAAALARTHVLDLLLFHGADARKLNYEGESALMRAVQVTNNYENQTFMDLLELLHDTIPLTDKQNRTVLHHISLAAGIDGRERAARYYADFLLQWIAGLADGYQVDTIDPAVVQELNGGSHPPSPSQSAIGLRATAKASLDSTVASEASSQQTATDQLLATPRQKLKMQTPAADRTAVPASGVDAARSADFAAFLNLQDTNGDTALNLAARIGDRTMIRLLLNAGASPTIANRVGLRPLDFGVDQIATVDVDLGPLVDSEIVLEDSSLLMPSNRSEAHVPLGSTPLAAPQTPIRSAMRNTGKNLFASLMASGPSHGPHTNGPASLDDTDDVWSPSSAQMRIHESVQNIQQLMTDMESDFSSEMRVKQERLDGIKLQLRKTTIELAKARETIHRLHSETSQLGEVTARVEYLEETLARETAAVREAISALPLKSKPRLDLEKLLDALLTSSEDAPEPGMILPLVPNGKIDDDLEELEKEPAKMRAAVERLRVANQVYARRDALLRERIEALRKRADVSERERQYRQIIASCCEISVNDVDVWIDRLISAVDANKDQDSGLLDGGSLSSAAGVAAATTTKK
ncbi:transcriptional regulator swi6 [Linderina macrospora]|uniref:Transcriptional regulator swi6 n=1 Tax=Linderina macrospora TaxID=4868 RepID=A0ACC1J6K2_9FUNG|nr:transcriptional regulator swi6 [Linderina macrospora]